MSRVVATIQCPRCRVSVPVDKVDAKDRCLEKDCPLNSKGKPHE